MIVGMMANFSKPTKLAKFTSLICKNYGLELIYMRPRDVNINNGTIKGKVFRNNQWEQKVVSIPKFIDISPYCFKKKNEKVTNYLKEKTFLSDNRKDVLTKSNLQNLLKNDSEFSYLVIPTYKVNEYTDIKNNLKKYGKVVLKPSGGIRGKRIYILSKVGEKYLLGYKTEEEFLNDDELESFYREKISGKNYLLQQYVSSRTPQGDPFDCRIHIEKNGDGKWESARNYIRIGIGQKVISNVNQGGGIANPEPFLKANFGEEWEDINNRLNELAVTLPYRIEELRGTHIMSLGMDIGIGKDGELYLFEVNDGPDTTAVISEVAFLRSNYYRYIFTHKLNVKKEKTKVKPEKIDKEYENIIKERDYYKKEYNKIRRSTSWRLTSPIRKVGSIRKKFNKK